MAFLTIFRCAFFDAPGIEIRAQVITELWYGKEHSKWYRDHSPPAFCRYSKPWIRDTMHDFGRGCTRARSIHAEHPCDGQSRRHRDAAATAGPPDTCRSWPKSRRGADPSNGGAMGMNVGRSRVVNFRREPDATDIGRRARGCKKIILKFVVAVFT